MARRSTTKTAEGGIAEALSKKKLTAFENREVTKCKIEIPGAAGGLREALDFDPVEIGHDEERTLVMRVRCKKVRFDEIKDSDCLARVHVLEPLPGGAAFIDDKIVKKAIDDQQERVRLAREREAGIQRIGFKGDEGEEPFGQEPDGQ